MKSFINSSVDFLRSLPRRLTRAYHLVLRSVKRQLRLATESLASHSSRIATYAESLRKVLLSVKLGLAAYREGANQLAKHKIKVFTRKVQPILQQAAASLFGFAERAATEFWKQWGALLAWLSLIARRFGNRAGAGAHRIGQDFWAWLSPILLRLRRNANQLLRDFYYPILTQVTVPYLFLALLVGVGGTYLATEVAFDSREERFTNELIETALLTKESIVREEGRMLETLRLVSNTEGVAQAIAEGNAQLLRSLILPIAYNAGIDAAILFDRNEQSILGMKLHGEDRSFAPFFSSNSLVSQDFVQHVLGNTSDAQGDKFAGIAATADGDYFFLAGPIFNEQGGLAGVVLLGKSLDNLTELLREQAHGQVSIYLRSGTPLASTFNNAAAVDSERVREILALQDEGSFMRSFDNTGIAYDELLSGLEVRSGETVALLGVALPTNFLAESNLVTREGAFGMVSFMLLVVGTVGFYVAGKITRPIQELRRAAMKVAKGNFDVRVPDVRPDEVGVLTESFNTMVDSLRKTQQDLLDAYDRTIEGWARAVELRDHQTEGHSRRVADLAVELAGTLGLQGEELENLRRGALLHDIGKIATPDYILLKKGKLTPSERKIMQQHPLHGKDFLSTIEFLKPAAPIPFYHHEKWDGSGYPRGLRGTGIPLGARIFAVVDVWDALTSDRPYRRAMTFDEALDVIRAQSNRHFDPQILEAFVLLMNGKKAEKNAGRARRRN